MEVSVFKYANETKDILENLVKARDHDICKYSDEGNSLREVAAMVGCDHTTVKRIVGVASDHDSQKQQSAEEGVQNDHDGQTEQTIFTHATSVTLIANPWETTITKKEGVENDHDSQTRQLDAGDTLGVQNEHDAQTGQSDTVDNISVEKNMLVKFYRQMLQIL